MANEKAEFRSALEEIRNGSPDAVWKFIEQYGPHIRRIARRHLDARMQSKFDSIDFVQMVWVSFFRNPRAIRSFHHPDDVSRYLGKLVRNKVCDEYRRRIVSAKHNVTREEPMHGADDMTSRTDTTPSQVAIAREQWQLLLTGKPPQVQSIAQLRLEGATFSEISEQLRINERTVRRIVGRLLKSYEGRAAPRASED